MHSKTFYDSKAVLAELVLPYQSNAAGNIHGGEIMKMMDSTAGVAAMKYSQTDVVTARVDELCFKLPIHIGELVTCTAHVVYAGKTSMETFVTVESENTQTGSKKIALTAFFTMVALDHHGKPCRVPSMKVLDEPFVQRLYREGEKRYFEHNRRK
jgi:acyl-CoA hydrolase